NSDRCLLRLPLRILQDLPDAPPQRLVDDPRRGAGNLNPLLGRSRRRPATLAARPITSGRPPRPAEDEAPGVRLVQQHVADGERVPAAAPERRDAVVVELLGY